jgi:hypothetical protein
MYNTNAARENAKQNYNSQDERSYSEKDFNDLVINISDT